MCIRDSDSTVQQCLVVSDDVVTSTDDAAEARRDSGISVTSSLVTTTCTSDLPLVATSQHAAIVEEPGCDISSVSDADRQPGTGRTQPAVLPWISLPNDQGYSSQFRSLLSA